MNFDGNDDENVMNLMDDGCCRWTKKNGEVFVNFGREEEEEKRKVLTLTISYIYLWAMISCFGYMLVW